MQSAKCKIYIIVILELLFSHFAFCILNFALYITDHESKV
jgi:hypothetical protein